ncbi:MAG TPA: VTT domain-containing protein [Acidobacteriaceae bacterium]|jgi:membrane protein DedA with SNARE-associated domain/rhodanese-related sulfurtransferase
MNLFALVAHHGYATVMVILFCASCGLPLPLSVALLIAGAAAHGGVLNLGLVILCAWGAALLGDTIMYLGGRFTGWWLLAGICRISMNPESCIFGSANSFYRRGPKALLFAKFVPGLSTVAAPLAGSLNMKLWRFWRLDACGVLFYVTAWSGTGFLFARFLRVILSMVTRLGHITAATVLGIIALYVGWLAYNWIHDQRFKNVERVAAQELHDRLRDATHDRVLVIADVRSHGYYDPGMQRIKNSIRVEPSRLKEELVALREFMAPECEIYLYCSCAREATSVRVAHMLEMENCQTKVIQGGLKAWIKAGGPLEPVPAGDVEHLPQFD